MIKPFRALPLSHSLTYTLHTSLRMHVIYLFYNKNHPVEYGCSQFLYKVQLTLQGSFILIYLLLFLNG